MPTLTDLEKNMAIATDFADVWTYFLDHFGEDPAFLERGRALQDKAVQNDILAAVSRTLNQQAIVAKDIQLIEVPPENFVHGMFMSNGKLTGVIYFKDIRAGIVAVSKGGSQMVYGRFSVTDLPKRGH